MTEHLDERANKILQHVVDAYVETREPVGSLTLSKRLGFTLSSATIRNVMADLESAGFLFSPHTSSGRMPTEAGLQFCLNGLLGLGTLDQREKEFLEKRCQVSGKNFSDALEEMTLTLSGLSQCAGLVLAPKRETILKHAEFVFLKPGRAMVILIAEDSSIENRVIEIPEGLRPCHLAEASSYLARRLVGHRLEEARRIIFEDIKQKKAEADDLVGQIVETGLASWEAGDKRGTLIVRGQSHLLSSVRELEDLKNIRHLFSMLDTQEGLLHLLDATIEADGVQIFIGSKNPLFDMSGCALIVAPYGDHQGRFVGAIGVIGPTYMDYRRIIPMVDYTSHLLGRMLG